MSWPRATYRLQFRNGFDFQAAADLAPYLERLGISHVYASPIYAARNGSTHGYDVTDFGLFDPALGGNEGFERMSDVLKQHGLGLVLDFVPNHMAASVENPWWRDVLYRGTDSEHGDFFDIDWERYGGKLLLPVLGDSYGDVLARGELKLAFEDGQFAIGYFDNRCPASERSVATLRDGGQEAAERISRDAAAMHELLELQHYRIAHWRMASDALNYRRFFDINDLVALRMERQSVFEHVHRFTFDLIRRGVIDGLRLDHIDGLLDPGAYLTRLRQEVEQLREEPFYIVVEKILEGHEKLRPQWPVEGTTGYEFGCRVTGLQVHHDGAQALSAHYQRFTDDHRDYQTVAEDSKRFVLSLSFATDLNRLARMAYEIAQSNPADRDVAEPALRRAITEVLIAFPLYRTYVTGGPVSEEDEEILHEVALQAEHRIGAESEEELRFVLRLLRGDDIEAADFAMAFQQVSGPLTAKALEDTAFYRYIPLIALNEVGSDPGGPEVSPSLFHAANQERAEHWPDCMLTTSTHDTKRGEDTRARIAVLSEIPEQFFERAERWWQLHAQFRRPLRSVLVPHPKEAWLYYQALLGIWPLDKTPDLKELRGRMRDFMSKALKEAKEHTRWTDPVTDHEQAVFAFIDATLDTDEAGGFLKDIAAFSETIAAAGALNGLSQVLLKLTSPGVPDIYQGCEWWDQSLVDPDNRRPVDFVARAKALSAIGDGALTLDDWRDGRIKQGVTARLLNFRRSHDMLFRDGAYQTLKIEGPQAAHVFAFARTFEGKAFLSVATRHGFSLLQGQKTPLVLADAWEGTELLLPPELAQKTRWQGVFGDDVISGGKSLPVKDLLAHLPIAALTTSER
ncbi:(1-_4)-alpha-D-glucan 1-alpha-D-glucosylmutase [Rhodoligotrophos appendicifer]|uniref:malto-oligosyltrehalose synthase n=1 Tax=Rhodoligotrophos appendicifer TaxID=987056 RepID=UPI001187152E|nr:malto-oligosyltrehalose synthase [Rhodoligotrophos appendicifer]